MTPVSKKSRKEPVASCWGASAKGGRRTPQGLSGIGMDREDEITLFVFIHILFTYLETGIHMHVV